MRRISKFYRNESTPYLFSDLQFLEAYLEADFDVNKMAELTNSSFSEVHLALSGFMNRMAKQFPSKMGNLYFKNTMLVRKMRKPEHTSNARRVCGFLRHMFPNEIPYKVLLSQIDNSRRKVGNRIITLSDKEYLLALIQHEFHLPALSHKFDMHIWHMRNDFNKFISKMRRKYPLIMSEIEITKKDHTHFIYMDNQEAFHRLYKTLKQNEDKLGLNRPPIPGIIRTGFGATRSPAPR